MTELPAPLGVGSVCPGDFRENAQVFSKLAGQALELGIGGSPCGHCPPRNPTHLGCRLQMLHPEGRPAGAEAQARAAQHRDALHLWLLRRDGVLRWED